MIEVHLIIPERGPEAELPQREVLTIQVNRCRLPRCQKVLRPGLQFCDDQPHRQEYDNKYVNHLRHKN